MMRQFIFIVCFFIFAAAGHAQFTSTSKKAVSRLQSAQAAYRAKKYKDAITQAQEALKADAAFVEPYLLMAAVYAETGNIERAVDMYKQGFLVNADFFPNAFFDCAMYEMRLGRYAEARDHFNQLIASAKGSEKLKQQAAMRLPWCDFAAYAIAHPVPYTLISLGDSVNSRFPDYWPSLSADKNTFIITRRLPVDSYTPYGSSNFQEDFYISSLKPDKTWTSARSAGFPLNTPDNEGAPTITADGKKLYFTGCNRNDGKGMCDIYLSVKAEAGWSKPRNIGAPVNTAHSEKQPSASADGNMLFFSSNRPGTYGGLDLWVTRKDAMGKWTEPKNLGPVINTTGDDCAPFFHPDGKTLYFSSEGHIGMGAFDLFVTRMDSSGKWEKPENLGYPINTTEHEEGIFIDCEGKRAYIAVTNQKEKDVDIFSFDLYDKIRPVAVSYMKGRVYDAVTMEPLQAMFELTDLKEVKTVFASVADTKGEFLVTIPAERDYALSVEMRGYLFFSENFTMSGKATADEPFFKDVSLHKIQPGQKIILKNIFFATDSFNLKAESKAELQKIVGLLNDNPFISAEISGHTDNAGSDEYNLRLSENRARSVVEYLVSAGIVSTRLIAKGYGELQPIAPNETPEGRAQNRRTELKIINR